MKKIKPKNIYHQIIVLKIITSSPIRQLWIFSSHNFISSLENGRCDTESSFILHFVYELHLQPFRVLPTAGYRERALFLTRGFILQYIWSCLGNWVALCYRNSSHGEACSHLTYNPPVLVPRLLNVRALLVTSISMTLPPRWLWKLQECLAETVVSLGAASAFFFFPKAKIILTARCSHTVVVLTLFASWWQPFLTESC